MLTSAAYSAAVVGASAVLMWSGLAKIRAPSRLAETLSELGIPHDLSRALAVFVPLCEIATVVFLVAGVPSPIVAFLLAMLGISFAAAAIVSKLAGKAIRCACFGASERKLGWPQLLALPLWLFSAWAVLHIPRTSLNERLAIFACTIMIMTALQARRVLLRAAGARSDRRAFVGG